MSITNSTSAASTTRGYGGLASGLDTDSLIKGMTIGTQGKIDKQMQNKQTLLWRQEAYRSISLAMINFSDKYTSYTSSSNLTSSSFFSQNNITASGANSSYLSVSGTLNGPSHFSVTGVKQLAVDASASSTSLVSDQLLNTGELANDLSTTMAISNLEGKTLAFEYGNTTFNVKLETGTVDGFEYKYDTMENAANSINEALKKTEIQGGVLSDVIDIKVHSGNFVFTSNDTAGNTILFKSGTGEVLDNMGFTADSEITKEGLVGETATLAHEKSIKDLLGEKSITFTYNGVTKKITLDSADELKTVEDLKKSIQDGLNIAFGSGRIEVSLEGAEEGYSSLSFKTTRPDGSADNSSVIVLSGADIGLLGDKGVFSVSAGESNRVNLTSSLLESGISASMDGKGESDTLELTINGVEIKDLTYASTMKEIMDTINKTQGVNVNVSYLANADKFSFKSTESGAAGSIKVEGAGAEIFGSLGHINGQDAIVTVNYAGSSESMDIVRGSNNFSIDGLNITVNKEFGFDKSTVDGSVVYTEKADNEEITFTAAANSEEIVSVVKKMVEDYNEILDMINKEITSKRDRSYQPLTDAQKEEMTESQIEKWEEKSKVGLLFNDSSLKSLYDEFRFMIPAGGSDRTSLAAMGISVSTKYADNGKLTLDETKLKKAIESDPESVKDAFTRTANTTTGVTNGFMPKLSSLLNKYAGTTGAFKGILINKAGSSRAPTSVLSNSMQKEIDEIDKVIKRFESQLKSQTDRYIKQFTTLETMISQMNAQSSWLATAFEY